MDKEPSAKEKVNSDYSSKEITDKHDGEIVHEDLARLIFEIKKTNLKLFFITLIIIFILILLVGSAFSFYKWDSSKDFSTLKQVEDVQINNSENIKDPSNELIIGVEDKSIISDGIVAQTDSFKSTENQEDLNNTVKIIEDKSVHSKVYKELSRSNTDKNSKVINSLDDSLNEVSEKKIDFCKKTKDENTLVNDLIQILNGSGAKCH